MKHIATKSLTLFRRCGVEHTRTGATFEEAAFSPGEWAILEAEPQLVVTPVAAAPVDPRAVLVAGLRAVIAGLSAADFGADGKPSVGALREAVPIRASAISTEMRDAVWAGMLAEGFEPPAPEQEPEPEPASEPDPAPEPAPEPAPDTPAKKTPRTKAGQ